jgi:hypothetical protein
MLRIVIDILKYTVAKNYRSYLNIIRSKCNEQIHIHCYYGTILLLFLQCNVCYSFGNPSNVFFFVPVVPYAVVAQLTDVGFKQLCFQNRDNAFPQL